MDDGDTKLITAVCPSAISFIGAPMVQSAYYVGPQGHGGYGYGDGAYGYGAFRAAYGGGSGYGGSGYGGYGGYGYGGYGGYGDRKSVV